MRATSPPFLLLLVPALLCSGAAAETAFVSGKVESTLVHNDGAFGGCMALLTSDPNQALPSCGPGWVTFSCTGEFTDSVSAYRSFDQAQLALVADKNVTVQLDDTRRHGDYCFATRIDVSR